MRTCIAVLTITQNPGKPIILGSTNIVRTTNHDWLWVMGLGERQAL